MISQRFVCPKCGHKHLEYREHCQNCSSRGLVAESFDPVVRSKKLPGASRLFLQSTVLALQVAMVFFIAGLNEILGGGLLAGSLCLLIARSATGKTTFVLQNIANLLREGKKVLLYSGEMSRQAILSMANRYGLDLSACDIMETGDIGELSLVLKNGRYNALFIDSLQTIQGEIWSDMTYHHQRMIIERLRKIANSTGIPIFIITQVDKTGNFTGPNTIFQTVDVALEFRKDVSDVILCEVVKNRQNSRVNDIICMRRTSKGLVEIPAIETGSIPRHGEEMCQEGMAAYIHVENGIAFTDELSSTRTPSKKGDLFVDSESRTLTAFMKSVLARFFDLIDFDLVIRGTRVKKLDRASDMAVAVVILSRYYRFEVPMDFAFMGQLDGFGRFVSVPEMPLREQRAREQGYRIIFGPPRIGTMQGTWEECQDVNGLMEKLLNLAGIELSQPIEPL